MPPFQHAIGLWVGWGDPDVSSPQHIEKLLSQVSSENTPIVGEDLLWDPEPREHLHHRLCHCCRIHSSQRDRLRITRSEVHECEEVLVSSGCSR